ncbi:MAG: chemotaxis-specific protein-glutamate methyltransferase CheB [Steroidobacteraceae bacterium]
MALRIGIVNDLKLATAVLERAVKAGPGMSVAWTAADGAEAVERCAADLPDIVLMDLVMPNVDGVEATRRIMAATPCPILLVTATVEGNMDLVYEAMGHGALDACTTPVVGDRRGADDGAELRRKIEAICGAAMPNLTRSRPAAPLRPPSALPKGAPLVAIGTSTGGPAALADILAELPPDLAAPVVLLQHINDGFVEGLRDWLAGRSRLPLSFAMAGEPPRPGHAYLARSHSHLVLRATGTFDYQDEPRGYFYHPSVNEFFSSAARHAPAGSLGVLLTGMGRDGAEGLLAMRQAGHHTIAQDRASSVVYGMPAAAAELGAAVEVLPLGRIAARISHFCQERVI